MKKIKNIAVILTAFICFVLMIGCSKDESKQYTIKYDADIEMYPGTTTTITAIEYDANNQNVNSNAWVNPVNHTSKTFDASSDAVKVKLYMSFSNGTSYKGFWIQKVYSLSSSCTMIDILPTTQTGSNEPY